MDKIDLETLGYSLLVLVLALIIRMFATYVAVMGGELNVKEKIFMAFAWLPKATVQAALGPVALGKAREALAEYINSQANITFRSRSFFQVQTQL